MGLRVPSTPITGLKETVIKLAVGQHGPAIGVGSDLKNSICALCGRTAVLSGRHGNLSDPQCYRAFVSGLGDQLSRVRALANEEITIGHDLHPGFASRILAEAVGLRSVGVQHHHAHGVSCAVDAGIALPVVAVVCDGAGYGSDGVIWGGEVLLCHATSFERLAHLNYFPLPGGDAAARAPWRSAVALSRQTASYARACDLLTNKWGLDQAARRAVETQMDRGINARKTSSLGRFFDAASCFLGYALQNSFEGDAAIRLTTAAESVADETHRNLSAYPFDLIVDTKGAARICWKDTISALIADMYHGSSPEVCAYRFHQSVAAMFADAAIYASQQCDVSTVALTGGCFQNPLLTRLLTNKLLAHGLTVITHRQVSCGDAGLSLGQAFVASSAAELAAPATRSRRLTHVPGCTG